MSRLDRYGDPVEVDQADVDERHEPDCPGWRGEDHAGRPRPCLICRPHLRRRRPGPDEPIPGGWTAKPIPHTTTTTTI